MAQESLKDTLYPTAANEAAADASLFKDMQRADEDTIIINNEIYNANASGAATSAPASGAYPVASAPSPTVDSHYGQDALIAQLEQASANIDGKETETTNKISNKPSGKDEAMARLTNDGDETPKASQTQRVLTTLAIIATVAVLGYFGGAFLAANVPAIGSTVSGIGGMASGLVGHATAFLQGAGILSVAAPTTSITLGAGASSVAVGGGVLGAIGATFLAMKTNVLQMVGIENAVNPTITGHETTAQAATLSKTKSIAATQGLDGPSGVDTMDATSVVDDMSRSSSMQAKMSKAAQYAGKHDEYAVMRDRDRSWADRVGGKSAQSASYADALQDARAMQAELASESGR